MQRYRSRETIRNQKPQCCIGDCGLFNGNIEDKGLYHFTTFSLSIGLSFFKKSLILDFPL
ncbi:hypothetical protein [Paenibacillus alginolyticus]|uniref:Uncharacterized protein n=1 Tax=Paenibacillus alginolyticus TaxID=59839 RepID=A0ABT4GQ06_9BACL|nr:hypothetical protein [Paenibacillus alginolyticus]MCY9698315.1 hypothetical protein [Paenibacillus alginolyticus]MEC0142719.1 hypothetical protein [Paenibacillus alginolyticus]